MENTKIKSFTQLYANRRKKFISFACSYVCNKDVADDIVMDSFMYYWENIDTIEPGEYLETYILKVIKNKCLNYLKRLSKQREIGEYINKMELWELDIQISTLEACNPDKLFSKEIQEIISKSVSGFPRQTRIVFILSRYKNKTNKEIAAALGISLKNVEYHITKSLKLLRIALKDYLPLFILFDLFH